MKISINDFIIMAFIGALLNVFGCSGGKDKIMNEKTFTNYYLKVLEQQFPDTNFIITGDLEISSIEKPDNRHFLDNAYRTYKLAPEAIEETVLQYVNGLISSYEEPKPIQKNKIVPAIKHKDYLEKIRELNEKNEKKTNIIYEPYNEDLIIVYMKDSEYSLSSITIEDFEKSGIDQDTLLDYSINNMLDILPEIKRFENNGIYYIAAGGNFEASLILLKSIWTKDNFNVDGDFVIAIPCRDLLYITGSNNIEGIKTIRESAAKMHNEGDHNISPFLYKWDGEKFIKMREITSQPTF